MGARSSYADGGPSVRLLTGASKCFFVFDRTRDWTKSIHTASIVHWIDLTEKSPWERVQAASSQPIVLVSLSAGQLSVSWAASASLLWPRLAAARNSDKDVGFTPVLSPIGFPQRSNSCCPRFSLAFVALVSRSS